MTRLPGLNCPERSASLAAFEDEPQLGALGALHNKSFRILMRAMTEVRDRHASEALADTIARLNVTD
jgi:hypothetical protein